MTSKDHRRGSEGNHTRKTKDAKENGIWRQWNDEEYKREKAEIIVHLDVMMELLQKEMEDQRFGFLMRRRLKWHKLQKKRQLINDKWEAEIFKEKEYLRRNLKAKTSSEAKKPQCFKTNTLCMFAGTMYEEEQIVGVVTKDEKEERQNLNSVLEENGTVESHVHVHAQLNERSDFQFTVKIESKENLVNIDGQELEEGRGDIHHSSVMLEKDEHNTIEDFLNLVVDLEQ